jgi:ferritin
VPTVALILLVSSVSQPRGPSIVEHHPRGHAVLTPKIQGAINAQINNELTASYSYLAMSAYCAAANFWGSSTWLRIQSEEEHSHAMKLLDFMLDRNAPVPLKSIGEPRSSFDGLLDIFQSALKQEREVSGQIEALYELAFQEKSFAALAELQWFLTEQVEEEKTCREIVAKLKMIHDDPAAMIDLDRELGSRTSPDAGDE